MICSHGRLALRLLRLLKLPTKPVIDHFLQNFHRGLGNSVLAAFNKVAVRPDDLDDRSLH